MGWRFPTRRHPHSPWGAWPGLPLSSGLQRQRRMAAASSRYIGFSSCLPLETHQEESDLSWLSTWDSLAGRVCMSRGVCPSMQGVKRRKKSFGWWYSLRQVFPSGVTGAAGWCGLLPVWRSLLHPINPKMGSEQQELNL